MKFISLDTVLSDVVSAIPAEYFNESDVKEWAFKAMRAIRSVEQFENHLTAIPVADYKATLPDDCMLIELMAYKLDTDVVSEDALTVIMNDIGIDNDTYYAGFSADGLLFSQFRPLRLSKSPFAKSVHCEDCINLQVISEHTYSVHPNGSITTSFSDGQICLAYRRLAKDCDDNYLIPDLESYITALKSFVLMRIWEYRWNMKEEGAKDYYMTYKSDWQTFAQKAKGELKTPSLDQLENIRQTRNRLIPKERDYYTGFRNRKEEDLTF